MKNADIRALELIYEANLVDQTPLKIAINDILIDKEVTDPRVKKWFQKSFIAWYTSPADEEQKQGSLQPYQAKEGDPDWMRKPDIMTFTDFTPQQKQSLSHVVDFLVNQADDYKDDLAKGVKTLAQVKQDIINADEAAQKQSIPDIFRSKQTVLSQEGKHYNVIQKYAVKTKTGVELPVAIVQLVSNFAFREESCNLGHCVGRAGGESRVDRDKIGDPNKPDGGPQSSYFKQFQSGKIVVLALKRMDGTGVGLATIELSNKRKTSKGPVLVQPGDDLSYMTLAQAKGPHNTPPDQVLLPVLRRFFKDYNIKVAGPDAELLGYIEHDGVLYDPTSPEFAKIKETVLIPEFNKLKAQIEKNSYEATPEHIKKIVDQLPIKPIAGVDEAEIRKAIYKRMLEMVGSEETLKDSYNKDLVNQYLQVLVEGFRYGKI